jgi:hypothetical protein
LKVHGINDVRQTVIHTAESLLPEPNAFELELAIGKLNSYKSQGIDKIPAELIKAGVEQFSMTSTNVLFLFGIKRHCLRSGRSRSLYLSIRRAIKQTVVITRVYHFCQLRTKFVQHPVVKVYSIYRGNYWGSSMWISTSDHIFCIRQIFEKKMGMQRSRALSLYKLKESLYE